MTLTLQNLFQSLEKDETLPTSLHGATLVLMPKPDEDRIRKKNC